LIAKEVQVFKLSQVTGGIAHKAKLYILAQLVNLVCMYFYYNKYIGEVLNLNAVKVIKALFATFARTNQGTAQNLEGQDRDA